MNEQPVSERIKILLERYTYGNKAALGRSLGVSGQAIADLIEGKKGGPSFSVLQKMLTTYAEIRAEWLVLGEEPMFKTQVEIGPDMGPVAYKIDRDDGSEQISVTLSDEQLSQVFQAAYRAFVGSEEIRGVAASVRAKAQAEVDMLVNVYRVGEPDTSRPFDGLLSKRLGISEDEARDLILSGRIRSYYGGHGNQKRMKHYRVSEYAVVDFLKEPSN